MPFYHFAVVDYVETHNNVDIFVEVVSSIDIEIFFGVLVTVGFEPIFLPFCEL
ncbi:hypothetical protein CIP106467_4629 [Citrobacter europaeus]|nr:hypothetical protein CIP106467_4629 [Citrobacter europaeus]